MIKFIFGIGCVASSLGKSVALTSLATSLKLRGLTVTLIKLAPYINLDLGTM